MKRVLLIGLMILCFIVGFTFLYIGLSLLISQLFFVGLSGIVANILVDGLLLGAGSLLVFFALRWGASHATKALGVLCLVGAVVFLALGINMMFRFLNSFPSPSDAWLMSMALSRASILGAAPFIDVALISRARLVASGMTTISLIITGFLAWFGIRWIKSPKERV